MILAIMLFRIKKVFRLALLLPEVPKGDCNAI